MAVAFKPRDILGRGDLDIFLTNSSGYPMDAYEVTYALYYVSSGCQVTETLVGLPDRTPANPTVGEYYASWMVPNGASPGEYRIRWTFKERVNSPATMVVQEFAVYHP